MGRCRLRQCKAFKRSGNEIGGMILAGNGSEVSLMVLSVHHRTGSSHVTIVALSNQRCQPPADLIEPPYSAPPVCGLGKDEKMHRHALCPSTRIIAGNDLPLFYVGIEENYCDVSGATGHDRPILEIINPCEQVI